MITDDERREVARKLRRSLEFMRNNEERYRDDRGAVKCGNATYRNIAAAVEQCGNLIDDNYIHIVDRLADLIEPEERTCKVTYEYSGKQFPHCIHVKELSCGHEFRYYEPSYVPNFCPECGAKVVG